MLGSSEDDSSGVTDFGACPPVEKSRKMKGTIRADSISSVLRVSRDSLVFRIIVRKSSRVSA